MHNFKPGDWIRELGQLPFAKEVYQLTYEDFYGVGRKSAKYFKKIEPWHPQPNDWCWFYDSFNPQVTPVLAQFDYISDNVYVTKEIELPFSEEGPFSYGFNSCIPFIGILPDIPKDN